MCVCVSECVMVNTVSTAGAVNPIDNAFVFWIVRQKDDDVNNDWGGKKGKIITFSRGLMEYNKRFLIKKLIILIIFDKIVMLPRLCTCIETVDYPLRTNVQRAMHPFLWCIYGLHVWEQFWMLMTLLILEQHHFQLPDIASCVYEAPHFTVGFDWARRCSLRVITMHRYTRMCDSFSWKFFGNAKTGQKNPSNITDITCIYIYIYWMSYGSKLPSPIMK